MEYRPDLDLEIIILFEKLLVFFRSNRLRSFEYKQDRLAEELHIKRTRLENARTALKNAKILLEHNPGKGKKIRISLDKDMIINTIPHLYKMPEVESAKTKVIKELETFFHYFLSKKYLREKPSESMPDDVHEGRFSITAPDKTKDIPADYKDDGNDTHKNEE